MLVPPENEGTVRRGSLRLFVIANVAIVIVGLVVIWATGMLGGDIDWQGWIAIALALIATSLLGSALMTLAFYSSRTEHDIQVYRPPGEQPPADKDKNDKDDRL